MNVQTASGDARLTFSMVTAGGTTTFTPIAPGADASPLPSGYVIAGVPPAYDVASNAAFSGPITVCFTALQISSQSDFQRLRLLHAEGGSLVDRTVLAPDSPAPDFATRSVCARVDSLSHFILAFVPSSARFTVTGRILTPAGQGLRNTVVILTDAQGTRRSVTTSSFGVYTFDNITPASGYVLSASSKRYRFTPRDLNVQSNLTDQDLVGLE